ncbi:transketolase C-terminal domain-containing protein [Sorangium sp. So ce726]|uniref:transketolase family protein n=1 Tax=Sorangium sp. So ce726 TaxID=3133319 RepID=UPI003F6213D4
MKVRYEEALLALCQGDPRLMVMTAENRAAIRGLPRRLGGRFIDVGICEQTMIGAAAGLALRGRIPIVHALATFLVMRAFEFIRTDVGIPGLPVKLIGAVPGFLSEANGPTHQALEDVALMRGVPGMQVFCPADEAELVACLPQVIASPAPCYVRYTALPQRSPHPEPPAIGRAEVLSQGRDVAILTYGLLVGEALSAAESLAARGLSVRVVNLRWLKPIDEDAVLDALAAARLTVLLEDHFTTGGLASIVAELCLARGVAAPVLPISLGDRWFTPALLADVLEEEGFTGRQIAARVLAELDRRSSRSAPPTR